MRTAKRLIASALSFLMCMSLLVPALTPAVRAAETEPNYILSDKNIAAGKTATVSGVERYPDSGELTNFVGENLTDDDLATRWSSEPASHQHPVSAQIDLGKVEKLARIELYWEAGDSNNFVVQVSKDAASWNEVYKFQGTNKGVPHTDTIDLPQLTEARYVRFMAVEGGTAHLSGGDWAHDNVSLYEIKVYAGTEKAEPENPDQPAAAPVIGTQPEGAVYDANAQAAALTVAATAENGTLSYQWYAARTNDNTAGAAVAGAVQASFEPETAVAGTTYYYCVVTSTAGESKAQAVSDTAAVVVRGNLALHKDVTASGVENYPNTDTPTGFTADKLTDGVKTGDSRWSSDPASAQDPAFAQIDLGRVETLAQIKLFWEAGDSDQFKVEISNDPENPDSWKQVYSFDQKNQGVAHTDVIDLPAETYARYLRLSATKGGNAHVGNGVWAHDNISLYEIEAYPIVEQTEVTPEEALNQVLSQTPKFNAEGTRLVIPQFPGVTVGLTSTSNTAVIALDGTVHKPLNDMSVNLYYQVTDKNGEVLRSKNPKTVVVSGQYTAAESLQAKPNVIPALREWKGNEGSFHYSGKILISDESLLETAQQIAIYFDQMLGATAQIVPGTVPAAGEIALVLDKDSVVGEEGYTMNIAEGLTIQAGTAKGILYGGTSVCQIMDQSADGRTVPMGLVRDYPQYPVRAIMLDLARIYTPLDYLTEMVRYMGYFKINEFHAHINDNGGEQKSAFRVESKKFPVLNDTIPADQVYSQEDYKAFQKDVLKYGVEVINEIDSPAHCDTFRGIDPNLMHSFQGSNNNTYLDINNPDVLPTVKAVMDEFLDGEDPVFQGSRFHFGADEYMEGNDAYNEGMRAYIDELTKYIKAKGITPRCWAALGGANGFNGTTPVDNSAEVNVWNGYWAGPRHMYDEGYKMINTRDDLLYIVPGANYYHTYLNIANLFDSWEASQLLGGLNLQAGDPQLLGAEAALWCDIMSGAAEHDIFDAMRDQIMLISEKTWYGSKTAGQTGADFVQRTQAVSSKAPAANPARYVESKDKKIADYDFARATADTIPDRSKNHYDASNHGLTVKDGALQLDGKGWMSMPMQSIGYDYTLTMTIQIDAATPANAKLFDGRDGTVYFNYDNTGKLGYERKGFTYLFDAQIPVGEKITLTIVNGREADREKMQGRNDRVGQNAHLYLNGEDMGTGAFYKVKNVPADTSRCYTSFVLPVQRIGQDIHGQLFSMTILNRKAAPGEENNDAYDPRSDAQDHKDAAVTAGDGMGNHPAEHAKDYREDTFWSTNWAHKPTEAERPEKFYIQLDLGESKPVAGVRVLPRQGSNMGDENGTPTEFKVMVSDNGKDWEVLVTKKRPAGAPGWRNWYVVLFDTPVNARYVRYEGVHTYSDVAANNDLHMALAEIHALIPVKEEVPETDKSALNDAIETAKTKAEKDYTPATWAPFADALAKAEEVNADQNAAQDAVDAALADLEKAMQALVKKPVPTAEPTAQPTTAPTAEPTAKPTAEPTAQPTTAPTVQPTAAPTAVPTAVPVAPTTPPTPPQGGATQTGDTTNLMLWAVLTMVSGGAAATLYRKRRG